MPSKEARSCPISHHPYNVNLSQHLKGVHGTGGQERRQLIQRGIVDTEVMTTEPQSNIEKHIVFLEMLQCGELLTRVDYGRVQDVKCHKSTKIYIKTLWIVQI